MFQIIFQPLLKIFFNIVNQAIFQPFPQHIFQYSLQSYALDLILTSLFNKAVVAWWNFGIQLKK